MDAAEKLNAFLLKLSLWKCRLKVGNYADFPLLEDLILKDETRKESDILISMRKELCHTWILYKLLSKAILIWVA